MAIAQRPSRDPGSGHDAHRLELVDAVLAATDPEGCAAAGLEWLARHHGVQQGLCAGVDRVANTLIGLAGLRLPTDDVTSFRVELTARDHPLAVVMAGREPVQFRRPGSKSGSHVATPLGDRPFLAVPIHSGVDRSLDHGLFLLAGAAAAELQRAAVFAGAVLGTRMAALELPLGLAGERRHERELTLLRRGLEAVTDPILLSDAEGRILVANRRAETLLAAEDEMSEGRRRAVAMNNMLFSAAAFTGGAGDEPTRRELLLIDPIEGQDLLFELLSTPFEVARGEVGTVSILRDVTDLRRAAQEIEDNYRRLRVAEARTRAERDRLDLILNAALDPILVTDREGNLARMNPPAERLFSVPEGAGGSEPAERRVRANDVVLTSFLSKLAAAQNERLRGDLTLTDPVDGESIPMEARAAKVVSRQGEVTAVVTILHDLSEAVEKVRLYEQVKRHSEELELRVREATAELAEQNEVLRRQALELEQASALKSQFLANVSHELRTPLNAIIGYTSLLLEGVSGEMTTPQREKLGRVDSNAQSLLAIINDLLDISRIEAGKMSLDIQRFDPVELIDEVMAEVEPLIARTPLAVERELEPEIPGLTSDRQKVKQILINLLSNALKFTPEGSVRVRAGFDPAAECLRVAVADTGVGVPPQNRTSIFEAFGQSGGSFQRRRGGTGLGLSISRRLARMLGGDIHLESEVGVGSTFTLMLPRVSRQR